VLGALILAVLFMLMQRLTWRLMRCGAHYPISFLPAALLWYAMGDESVKLTYVVALLMGMGVSWLMTIFMNNVKRQTLVKAVSMLVVIPILY
jgi:hypothetical protein